MTGENAKYGIWWLPEIPSKEIKGILKTNTDGNCHLDLLGRFSEKPISSTFEEYPIILGQYESGQIITLVKCLEISTKHGMLVTSKLKVRAFLEGVHFERFEDITMKNISVQFAHLNKWTNISGFRINPDFLSIPRLELVYQLPEKITIPTEFGFEIRFEYGYSGISLPLIEKAEIKQNLYFILDFEREKELKGIFDLLYMFEIFFSIAITEPINTIEIIGITDKNKKGKLNCDMPVPIKIYYERNHYETLNEKMELSDMLFSLPDMNGNLVEYINNYIKKYEYIKPFIDNYYSLKTNNKIEIQGQLLYLIFGLEGYHRMSVWDDKSRKKIKEANFEKRIEDILLKYSYIIDDLFKVDYVELNTTIRNVRDYLSHYDERLRENYPKIKELIQLKSKIQSIYEMILLDEIGFNKETIKKLIHRRWDGKIDNIEIYGLFE